MLPFGGIFFGALPAARAFGFIFFFVPQKKDIASITNAPHNQPLSIINY